MPATLDTTKDTPEVPQTLYEAPAQELGHSDNALPDGVIAPEVTAPEEGFTPDTAEKCDWVLSKIADAKARAARIRENAETMAKQADAEAIFFEWKYGAALQDFARRELEGGRRKSLTLYHGVIGFRTKPAGVQIADDKAALEWAKANLPAAVVERIDRTAIGKALMETGECVNFAAFINAEEIFYVK